MARYLMIGFLFSIYWLVIDPHVHNFLQYVRYKLIMGIELETELPVGGTTARALACGFLMAVIMVVWPAYVIFTVFRYLSIFTHAVPVRHR